MTGRYEMLVEPLYLELGEKREGCWFAHNWAGSTEQLG
jgi:hypothetical protein